MSDIIAFVNKYKLNDIKIEDIQNISLFFISTSSLFSCLSYNLHHLSNPFFGKDMAIFQFNILMPIVGLHAFIDFFITKNYELKLHHIFILGIIFYNYYCNVSSEYRMLFLYPLLKTEISSIFYVLKYWLSKNTTLYNINSILFILSFFKLRIIDFYYEIIYSHSSFIIVTEKYSNNNYFLSSILIVSCYGLYLLNVYWFMIMCKILYKGILKSSRINTDIMCHYLCSYIYWFNIPLAIYIYSYHPNEKYILDMIGVVGLSITSYLYHYDIYFRLKSKKIDEYIIPDKENIVIFINDNIFIQLRSFLANITSYLHSPYFLVIFSISGLFHMLSMYNIILNILELFINHDDIKDNFINIHHVFTSIPIGVDVSLIAMNSTNEIAISFVFVNILMAMMLVVEPFYKLSHFAFHILLIAQTYYLCLSHSSNV